MVWLSATKRSLRSSIRRRTTAVNCGTVTASVRTVIASRYVGAVRPGHCAAGEWSHSAVFDLRRRNRSSPAVSVRSWSTPTQRVTHHEPPTSLAARHPLHGHPNTPAGSQRTARFRTYIATPGPSQSEPSARECDGELHLDQGQRPPDAEPLAGSERVVRMFVRRGVVPSVGPELDRMWPEIGVPVGNPGNEHHRRAGGDGEPADLLGLVGAPALSARATVRHRRRAGPCPAPGRHPNRNPPCSLCAGGTTERHHLTDGRACSRR